MVLAFKVESPANVAQIVNAEDNKIPYKKIEDITGGSISSRTITCGRTQMASQARIRLSFNGDSSFGPVYLREGFASIDYRILGLLYDHVDELAIIFHNGSNREGPYVKTGVISYADLPEKAEPWDKSCCDDLSALDVLKLTLRALPGKRTEKEVSLMIGSLRKDSKDGDACPE